MRQSILAFAILALIGAKGMSSAALAQTPEQPAAKPAVETPIVLRISKRLVEQLTHDEIEFALPLDDQFGDIPITGVVHTRSKVQVTLETSNRKATCLLTADGTAHATVTANKGPVTAHAQAWIPYHLETRVTFDGLKFKAHPIRSRLEVSSSVDAICTRRNGPLAQCVRRIASRTIDNAKPQLDAYLYESARHKCEVELAEVARELVDELNSTNQLDEMIIEHFPEATAWNYHVSSTDKIILAAVGPRNATIPQFRTQADGTMTAPLDLWVRTSWEKTLVIDAALLWNNTHELLKKVLPAAIAESLADGVTLTTEGNWFVVTIGHGAIEKAIKDAQK